MFFALYNMIKGRFTKEAIEEAKSNNKGISREEALRQMRKIASQRVDKK